MNRRWWGDLDHERRERMRKARNGFRAFRVSVVQYHFTASIAFIVAVAISIIV